MRRLFTEVLHSIRERMAMPLWKSISAVNLMLPKDERKYVSFCMFLDRY